jgi:thiol-disulfide isomerase/thioredoxin
MKIPAKIIVAAAALAIAAAAAVGIFRPEAAPEVRFVTLSGERFATSELRGKVVLVNFWATSCAICVAEMPMLARTHRKFAPRGFETVAVAMRYDHPNAVAGFALRRSLPFRVALDLSGEAASGFGGIVGTPTTFVLDRRGRIVQRYLGRPDEAELQALIERTLASAA